MTTNHIDQLAQWWEQAEEGIGTAGDVVIEHDDSPNFETPSYVVFTLGRDQHENLTYRRVLARAPKPKPAWHDAVAVVASTSDFGIRRVFAKDADGIWNDALSGRGSSADNLIDPVPLIEAKVTDETQDRVWRAIQKYTGEEERYRPDYAEEIDAYARAALGIEAP